MDSKARLLVPSGIEPIDKLLGGLESGLLYLAHGDVVGRSLFGVKFLLEGIRRGEHAALIISYSPEEAVRSFARLGYDCLGDVQSGRLVILEFADDIIRQVVRLRELAPMLRELGGLLDETRPKRLVFDPITDLLVSNFGNIETRVGEFATWARLLGSTSLLIADSDQKAVIQSLWPLVKESFRFGIKEQDQQSRRYLSFEKSEETGDQFIEADPARGIFLAVNPPVESPRTRDAQDARWLDIAAELLTPEPAPELLAAERVTAKSTPERPAGKPAAKQAVVEKPAIPPPAILPSQRPSEPQSEGGAKIGSTLDIAEKRFEEPDIRSAQGGQSRRSSTGDSTSGAKPKDEPQRSEELNDWLDELIAWAIESPGDQPRPEKRKSPAVASPAVPTPEKKSLPKAVASVEAPARLDAARTAEELLRPPDLTAPFGGSGKSEGGLDQAADTADEHNTIRPKDFRVLIIDSDPISSELLYRGVGEYFVETAGDAITGLAMLISSNPDLVILDLDLPVVDGFKLLAHIRSSLNMPIIVVSGLYVRSSDRIQSAELGADYYLTKPFSVKELRQKAKQLIARHRGISEWIVATNGDLRTSGPPPAPISTSPEMPVAEPAAHAMPVTERRSADSAAPVAQGEMSQRSGRSRSAKPGDQFLPYGDFVARVEENVKSGIENGSSFSIVGCRIQDNNNNGTITAVQLFGLVRAIVRNGDIISMNQRHDLVVLLAEADAIGAKAFIGRLIDRVTNEMRQEPLIWLRSFPHLEEATEIKPSARGSQNQFSSTASEPPGRREPKSPQAGKPAKSDPREWYINLLKKLQ